MSRLAHDEPCAALECTPGVEYDEGTFRYFLSVERARAERSNHALRVVFASIELVPGEPARISRARAAELFEGLRRSLRDTDITGWYRQDRVAAALLSERAEPPGANTLGVIERRVDEGVRQRLPRRIARALKVRVVQLRPRRARNEEELPV